MLSAAIGIWVMTGGSGVDQEVLAVWPIFTEVKMTVASVSAEMWQTVLVELLPAKWIP
ncbi:hypothetical protein [Rufibacter roseus]